MPTQKVSQVLVAIFGVMSKYMHAVQLDVPAHQKRVSLRSDVA